jgi:hypothetical protein
MLWYMEVITFLMRILLDGTRSDSAELGFDIHDELGTAVQRFIPLLHKQAAAGILTSTPLDLVGYEFIIINKPILFAKSITKHYLKSCEILQHLFMPPLHAN